MSRTAVTSILAAKVADELQLDAASCRAVVREFLRKSAEFLAENHQLTLEGLGTLRLVVSKRGAVAPLRYARRKGGRYPKRRRVAFVRVVHVSFTKSARLKKLARDYLEEHMAMDKFGVDESVENSEQLQKQAAQGCPECGSKVSMHGKVLMCPKCGTEPFEKQSSG